jgi:phage terminase large subunit
MQTATDLYIEAALKAGCPLDQIRNFLAAGIALLPKQLLASAAARLCDRPCTHGDEEPCTTECGPTMLGFGGARGGAKSHWAVAQVAADDCQRFHGLKCLVLRKVGKSGKENFDDLRRRMMTGIKHEYSATTGTVQLDNGSRILTGHYQNEKDVDTYLGIEYDVIVVEEATTLTRTKIEDIGTCNRSSKVGWRPRMYLTTNPGGVGHAWFKAMFVDPFRNGKETDTRFIAATARDNPFNNKEYIKKLLNLTGWKRRAWLDGDWDIAAGMYFTNFRRELVVKTLGKTPPHWRFWGCFDYGFVHYTAFYLMGMDGDGNVWYIDEHAERGWLPEQHAESIHAMLARHGLKADDLECIPAGHDCFSLRSNGKCLADDYRALGLILSHGNLDRVNGAAEFLRRFGTPETEPPRLPTLFMDPRCGRLIECIPSLIHSEIKPEDVKKVNADEDGLGGDDFYDAGRYGLMYVCGPRGGLIENPFDDER